MDLKHLAAPFASAALIALGAAMPAAATDRPDLGPRPQFPETDLAAAELGQLLFYDRILSGNRNIACSTCHHPTLGTSDGLSLGLGEGGIGLGPKRVVDPANPPEQRIPRNAPGLWNLGAREFTVMFHDGRLEDDASFPNGIRTPLGEDMVAGFDDALAAQAMFPVLSADEMAGHYSENEVAEAVRLGQLSQPGGAWDRIAARVAAVPEYRSRFDTVLGQGAPITFAEIANVLADFIRFEWRADMSPFDRYMLGEADLPTPALRGLALFYGKGECSSCHSGWLQTDHGFHALGVPQFGPGKAARFEAHHRDEGRIRVTGDPADAFAFRTPSLRNVASTAPYGHSGAFATLDSMVRHHLDARRSLDHYDRLEAVLPDLPGKQDWLVQDSAAEREVLVQAVEIAPLSLTDTEIGEIVAFLEVLTDQAGVDGRLGVPEQVPSGLPVDR